MQRISLYLDDDDITYLDKLKKEKKCKSRNEAISLLINEHKEQHDITIKNLYEFMAEKVAEKLKPQLNSIKHSSNKTNEDVQVLIELLNGVYVNNKFPNLIPDSQLKPHGALTNSRSNVKERILKQAYAKQNRLD